MVFCWSLVLLPVLVSAKLAPSGDQILVNLEDNHAWLDAQVEVADQCSFCSPEPDATIKDLEKVHRFNCQRVSKANTDYSHLAELYGQAVDSSWKSRVTTAQSLCDKAEQSQDPVRRAKLATCAWGEVLMRQRECCNVPGPPYCVSRSESQIARALVLVLAVVLAVVAASLGKCCGKSFFVPSLVLCSQPAQNGTAPTPISISDDAGESGAFSKDRELRGKLQKTWQGCTLVALSEREGKNDPALKEASIVDVFATHCENFDFQEDSVVNQFEHFISNWRSHCAALGDRHSEEGLLGLALDSLEKGLLGGYLAWKELLESRLPHPPAATGPTSRNQMEAIAMYLLVWGEAGNLRFMPEMVYFITWILLHCKAPGRVPRAGDSNNFLVHVVRPIYQVVFDEHHDCVALTKDNKDQKKLRENYGTYLPADCANYDDWNELFLAVDRLLVALQPWMSCLVDGQWSRSYEQLIQVDWTSALRNDKVKTHRELHSWWGVFVATHRLWFLHLLLFLLCMFAVSDGNYPYGRGWKVLLAGNDLTTSLSCVFMVVPLHIFAWKMGSWFTTGSALRRCGAEVFGSLFWTCLLLTSCITFLWVRYVDALGEREAWSSEILGVDVEWPGAVHCFVCCLGIFAILLQPFQNGAHGLSQVSSPPLDTKCFRWIFWSLVMLVKVWASLHGVAATEKAMAELKISRPGRERLVDLPKFSFGPNWDKDMIQWLAIWGTGFLCFVADTQFWFVVGCSILGFILACAERGGCWGLRSFIREDAMAKVPKIFSRRVAMSEYEQLTARQGPILLEDYIPPENEDLDYISSNSTENQTMSKLFPPLWDLIIDFMRCEDKLDATAAAQLKFSGVPDNTQLGPEHAPWEAMKRLCDRTLEEPRTVWTPSIFDPTSYGQRFIERHAGIIPSNCWPENLEVQWRLNAFARNLGSNDLPRPYLTPYVPGLTVLIPHYGEQILMQPSELYKKQAGRGNQDVADSVPLIVWLEKRYHGEFIAFTNRMKSQRSDWPDYGNNWEAYQEEHWKHICLWASMRSQTFWRTVEGCMLYLPALERFHEMVKRVHGEKLLQWDASAVFTCMGCMQRYPDFKPHEFDGADQLLKRFPRSFQIAYIGAEVKGPRSQQDRVHPRQARRYYSCLIDSTCPCESSSSKKRLPRFTVELPGFPILGDGKGDNQNHGIIFTRGSIIQAIDSNQGGYFEQMLLLPCALGEFRCSLTPGRRSAGALGQRIVGFAEHITSDIGSLGDFAAGAETAFGTVLQRCYAFLGARMHYGHPDMMNKESMMQQGGVSKATKMLNLSEDIFAGMDFTLRGVRRSIVHREYLHVGKGRDLGFNSVLFFFAKLSQGTGEQLLTRQMFRLGHELDLPEFLTFYYAHAGYYLTQFLLSKCIPLLVFIWLLVVLDDPEQNFPAMEAQDQDKKSGASIMAQMLSTQFAWLMPLFLLAQTMPLFLQMWWEKHFLAAVLRVVKQLFTLAPLHFIFQAKVIGANITREITLGGAKYKATGRQLPTDRAAFIGSDGLYNDYAVMSLYDGAQLFLAMMLVLTAGGLSVEEEMTVALRWWVFAVVLTICSWLLAPFIFNPYQFTCKGFTEDLANYCDFFFKQGGETWKSWYNEKLSSNQPLRASSVEVLKRAFFIGCLYTVANQKVHMLSVIFEGGQLWGIGKVIMPPMVLSIIFIAVLRFIAWILRCQGHEAVREEIITLDFSEDGDGASLMDAVRERAEDRRVRTKGGEVVIFMEEPIFIAKDSFPLSFQKQANPGEKTTLQFGDDPKLIERVRVKAEGCTVRNQHGEILVLPEAQISREDFPLSFKRLEAETPSRLKSAFEAFHYQADERIATIRLPDDQQLRDLWCRDWPRAFQNYAKDQKLLEAFAYDVRTRSSDLLRGSQRLSEADFPLSIVRKKELKLWLGMLLVMAMVPIETFLLLWKFHLMGWHKSLVVGILLKFSILCVVLELIECCLHIQGGCSESRLPSSCLECLHGFKSSIKTWLYGHRMAQDFFVSTLILLILSVGTAFDGFRKCCCGCEDCGFHNILIYRDPGGAHKRQENRFEQALDQLAPGPLPEAAESPLAAAPAVQSLGRGSSAPPMLEMTGQVSSGAPESAATTSEGGN